MENDDFIKTIMENHSTSDELSQKESASDKDVLEDEDRKKSQPDEIYEGPAESIATNDVFLAKYFPIINDI